MIQGPEDLVPGFSNEAEMCAIGSMILSERACDEVLEILDTDHFYRPSHKMIFGAIASLRRQDPPSAVDLVTLRDRLKDLRQLGEIGGEDYLISVAEFVPSPANSGYYAGIVKEKWTRRAYLDLGKDALSSYYSVDELRGRAERLSMEAARGIPPKSGWVSDFLDFKTEQGVMSGIKIVDGMTDCDGFPTGQTSLIMARSGAGKTAFMIQTATWMARHVGPTCYISFADLNAPQLTKRLRRNVSGFGREPADGAGAERWFEAGKEIENLQLYIHDVTESSRAREIESVRDWFMHRRQMLGFKTLFLDYAQRADTRRSYSTDYQRNNYVSEVVERLARDENIPIIVGSQVTPGKHERGDDDATKESKVWYENAGLALHILRLTEAQRQEAPEPYKGIEGLTDLTLRKNRFGPDMKRQALKWDGKHAIFRDID